MPSTNPQRPARKFPFNIKRYKQSKNDPKWVVFCVARNLIHRLRRQIHFFSPCLVPSAFGPPSPFHGEDWHYLRCAEKRFQSFAATTHGVKTQKAFSRPRRGPTFPAKRGRGTDTRRRSSCPSALQILVAGDEVPIEVPILYFAYCFSFSMAERKRGSFRIQS